MRDKLTQRAVHLNYNNTVIYTNIMIFADPLFETKV